ncbi:hypothetical protein ACFQX6_02750 [Streptosporangium lutulentum]
MVIIAGVLGLAVLAVPAKDMRLALPDAGTASADSAARKAYDLIAEGFGPGFNGRLAAVVTGDSPEAAAVPPSRPPPSSRAPRVSSR